MNKYAPYLFLTALGLSLLLSIAGTTLGVINLSAQQAPAPVAGSLNSVGGITYYLYGSGIGTSDTTITLTSFKQPVNNYPLSMSDFGTIGYLTLEPGSVSRQEFVSFTGVSQNADGTATLTGITRGLAPVSPYTASSTIQKQHAGGTQAVLSNPPQFYERFLNKYNTQTLYGADSFSSTSPPRLDQPGAQAGGSYIATTSEFASVAYVNAVALVSAPNSTTAVKGVVQLATAAQQASSTATGSTGASLVTTAGNATDTPQSKCNSLGSAAGAGCSIIALLTGKISQVWLDIFGTSNAWTNQNAFSATTTFAASNVNSNAVKFNTVSYAWPSSQGALGALLRNDGSGNLTWGGPARYVYATTTAITATLASSNVPVFATSTLFSFPAGSIVASSTISISASGTCTDGSASSGSCTLNIADQSGHILAPIQVSGLGSSQTHSWNTQITLANNAVGSGTISYISTGTEVTQLNNSQGSTSINLSTATGIYIVLSAVSSNGSGSGVLNAAMTVLNP